MFYRNEPRLRVPGVTGVADFQKAVDEFADSCLLQTDTELEDVVSRRCRVIGPSSGNVTP